LFQAILDLNGDDLTSYYRKKQIKPEDESSKKPQTARELLLEHLLLPFIVTYFRDSKCE
jgi:hypothetical protein